jgi:hypothetical protein
LIAASAGRSWSGTLVVRGEIADNARRDRINPRGRPRCRHRTSQDVSLTLQTLLRGTTITDYREAQPSPARSAHASVIQDRFLAGYAIGVGAGIDGVGERMVDGGELASTQRMPPPWCDCSGNLSPSERNYNQTRRAEPVSANRMNTLRMAVTTASSG